MRVRPPKTIWLAAAVIATLSLASISQSASAATSAPLSPEEPSATLRVLSPADARAYSAAFAAARRGQSEAAEMAVETVTDPCLLGRLAFERLMRPGYSASYAELRGWLEKYRDQPGADRILALARRKQSPGDAALPALPVSVQSGATSPTWSRVERLAERYDAPEAPVRLTRKAEAARDAYFAGQLEKAANLAGEAGDQWISGLVAYRQKRFDDAVHAFDAVAHDKTGSEWTRSAGAYWAARSAIAAGDAEKAPGYLRLAAATPYTFYGLIAERQLGLDPAVGADGVSSGALEPPEPTLAAPTVNAGAGLGRLVHSDERAHRAAALAQIGLKADAGLELRTALTAANSDADRRGFSDLALALNAPLATGDDARRSGRRFDLGGYATPDFKPKGGYTIDRALVLALVKQESRFNTNAKGGGARGLMQITPATAARISGDKSLAKRPAQLQDPALNLRLGQDYVAKLLASVKGDLLHAVAAYNAGPGPISKAAAQMPNADSLLVMESTPGGHTRDFVQHVVANYWIYRQIFGQPAKTLDAAASASKGIHMLADQGG